MSAAAIRDGQVRRQQGAALQLPKQAGRRLLTIHQENAAADRMRELPLLERDGFSGGETRKLISRKLDPAPESVA
jgi:hypothetical protein